MNGGSLTDSSGGGAVKMGVKLDMQGSQIVDTFGSSRVTFGNDIQ